MLNKRIKIMAEDKKELIYSFLRKNAGKFFNCRELGEKLNISYPTILKWVEVLNAENKVIVKDFGNIKLVMVKDDGREQ